VKLVRQILEAKGHDVWTIDKDALVYKALELMAVKNVGALVVVEAGKPVGMFSERDYARKVFLTGKSSKQTRVEEVMMPKVLYVGPDQTVEECMALMTHKHVRHLPVLDGERMIGLISIGDVVKALITQKEFVIEQLEHYITGGRWLG